MAAAAEAGHPPAVPFIVFDSATEQFDVGAEAAEFLESMDEQLGEGVFSVEPMQTRGKSDARGEKRP